MIVIMIERKLEEISRILTELQNLKVDIIGISNKEEAYFPIVCESSKFFNRTYWNSIKLFIIDMHKILNQNEDFSLISTINFAQSNIKKILWKHQIIYENLEKLKAKLESLDKKGLQSLKDLRDKHYAHNDKNKDKLKIELSLLKCWKMLETAQEIFNTLNYHFNNRTLMFENFFHPPNEIYKVYRYELIREMYFAEIVKYPEDGTLIRINQIIRKS